MRCITVHWFLFRSLALDHADMEVNVTIAAMCPERVDAQVVAASLPRGRANVTVIKGGMNVTNPESGTVSVIANAAVEACLAIDPDRWRLSKKGQN